VSTKRITIVSFLSFITAVMSCIFYLAEINPMTDSLCVLLLLLGCVSFSMSNMLMYDRALMTEIFYEGEKRINSKINTKS